MSNESLLQLEIDLAYTALGFYGVPKERAGSISNGIDVLVTRLKREGFCDWKTSCNESAYTSCGYLTSVNNKGNYCSNCGKRIRLI